MSGIRLLSQTPSKPWRSFSAVLLLTSVTSSLLLTGCGRNLDDLKSRLSGEASAGSGGVGTAGSSGNGGIGVEPVPCVGASITSVSAAVGWTEGKTAPSVTVRYKFDEGEEPASGVVQFADGYSFLKPTLYPLESRAEIIVDTIPFDAANRPSEIVGLILFDSGCSLPFTIDAEISNVSGQDSLENPAYVGVKNVRYWESEELFVALKENAGTTQVLLIDPMETEVPRFIFDLDPAIVAAGHQLQFGARADGLYFFDDTQLYRYDAYGVATKISLPASVSDINPDVLTVTDQRISLWKDSKVRSYTGSEWESKELSGVVHVVDFDLQGITGSYEGEDGSANLRVFRVGPSPTLDQVIVCNSGIGLPTGNAFSGGRYIANRTQTQITAEAVRFIDFRFGADECEQSDSVAVTTEKFVTTSAVFALSSDVLWAMYGLDNKSNIYLSSYGSGNSFLTTIDLGVISGSGVTPQQMVPSGVGKFLVRWSDGKISLVYP